MTRDEIRALLGIVLSFDTRRPFTDVDITAWQAALDDLSSFTDARDAVIAHYRDRTTCVMPAEVRAGVKQIRTARIERQHTDELYAVPAANPDDVTGYLQALRAGVTEIADGTERPRPVKQLTADAFHPVPKPDWGTRWRHVPLALRDRARRRAEGAPGPVVVDPEAT